MSIWVDKKYINLCSNRLDMFSWKSDKIANVRCPLCGDSKKDKTKTRGYFFPIKEHYVYKCHNCGISCGMTKFLEHIDESLSKEYNLEMFRERYNVREKVDQESLFLENFPPVHKEHQSSEFGIPVLNLKDDTLHPALLYLKSRGFTEEQMKCFYWCEDFSELAKTVNPETRHTFKESRLVVPIYDANKNLLAVQGRVIDKKSKSIRYLTERIEGVAADQLIFGIENVDFNQTIYICEGVYDSLCLDNAVGFLGVSTMLNLPEILQDKDLVFVLDNEPRNGDVMRVYKLLIERGHKIVIWPSSMREKDLNEMFLRYGKEQLERIIKEKTYVGLSADLTFCKWRIH